MVGRALVFTCLLLVSAAPHAAEAWGFEAHRFITDRAIDRLPPGLKPFYDHARGFIGVRSIDPDLWRLAGWAAEPPRHFLNLDAYGAFPFPDLPRDYDRAVERYGVDVVGRNGLVPWRIAEMYGRLRRAFEDQRRGGSDDALADARFYSALLAHYIADAHVPLHAVVNHDGQRTAQWGLHARFERELFDRYRDRLRVNPPDLAPVTDPRGFAFETLLSSYQASAAVFAADARAAAGRTAYDDAYFEALYGDLHGLLEERLSRSISAVSALITAAWDASGKPALPLDPPRRTRPVRPGSR
jgi:hypothetical protein